MDKLKVGFLTYSIEDFGPKEADLRGVYGTHSPATQIIKVDSNASKERRKEVLLHEILHAVWNQWMAQGENMEEEQVVNALAMGLMTVFTDNPGLKKELF